MSGPALSPHTPPPPVGPHPDGGILWTPTAERAAASRMAWFRGLAQAEAGRPLPDTQALHEWSLAEPAAFWSLVWRAFEVEGTRGEGPAFIPGAPLPEARFFPNARLNLAQNLLRRHPDITDDRPALIYRGERGPVRHLSWAALRRDVARVAAQLRALGIVPGDRVCALLPQCPEAIVAALGCLTVGAVWCSASPDFGPAGVLDRFAQVDPKLLFVADGSLHAGQRHELAAKNAAVAAGLPGLRAIVEIAHLEPAPVPDASAPSFLRWADWLDGAGAGDTSFAQLPFDHPAYILFSSGTTGAPKGIVHRAGGVLLKHLTEHALHCDIRAGDRVLYVTTLGWMMWNWQVSALAQGATLMLFEGSPFHPRPHALWDYIAEQKATLFGTSAKYIDALRKLNFTPGATRELSALRTICSTGSPLSGEAFDYVYARLKADLHLASVSGGTDIVGCFVLGDPTRPVRRGHIQAPALGLDVDVVDGEGRPLLGSAGELVCRNPFPSMPLGFWNDPEGKRYRAAYFEALPGIWHHGDFACRTAEGGFVITGRSDATLNPGGVRIGTAEIYRQVEALDAVQEALAVGQDWEGDVRVVLFVVMKEGHRLTEALERTIRQRVRDGASPRHVPARIVAVPALPRTRSGKLVELAVRDVIHGRAARGLESLANAEALDAFRDLPALRS